MLKLTNCAFAYFSNVQTHVHLGAPKQKDKNKIRININKIVQTRVHLGAPEGEQVAIFAQWKRRHRRQLCL